MSKVSELVDQLGVLGQQSKAAYEAYKAIEDKKTYLRAQLTAELAEAGLKSAKTDIYTASIVTKPSIVINHEQSVLDWLRETPDVDTDVYIGLKKTEFKTLAMAMLKETGEVIPGTDIVEAATISIRANKKA